MKLTTLITTASMLVSSLAFAAPAAADGYRVAGSAVVRDHRDRAPIARPPAYGYGYSTTGPVDLPAQAWIPAAPERSTWSTLATIDRIVDGEYAIDLGGGERIRTLRLHSFEGKTRVLEVMLHFANGDHQVVPIDRYLIANNRIMDIDVQGHGRRVVEVTLKIRNARSSSFAVLAI